MKYFSIILVFIFISAGYFSASSQSTFFNQKQDSLLAPIHIKNGKANIEEFNLFPETTALENLFLEVSILNLQQSEKFIQSPVRIELEREINGKKEQLEIARFFLPWYTGETKQNPFLVFDISDYASLFQEAVNVHIEIYNYSEPLELNLHFKWKRGGAPIKVNQIINLWRSDLSGFSYADKKNPINQKIETKTIAVSKEIKYALFKIYLSGRGQENQRPLESECSKYYFLKINNQTVAKRPVWCDDCSLSPLFPQEGPWTYSRANWCPGQALQVYEHFILLGSDTTLHIDLQLQEAVEENPALQNYTLSANLILFEKAQHENDAAIVEILAPNKNIEHNRYNPICGSPVIRVKNTGSDTLRSVLIEYGLDDKKDNLYRWRGELAFMEEEIVYLPPLNWYFYSRKNKPRKFCVSVEKVNTKKDEYEGNNQLSTVLNSAPVYPNKISIQFFTHQAAADNILELVDDMGIPFFEALDFVNDSVYTFALDLLPGCYEFIVYDKEGNGFDLFEGKRASLKIFDAKTKEELKDFEPNFGAEIRQQFMILK